MKYTFTIKLFGETKKRFHEGNRWLEIRKDPCGLLIFVMNEEYDQHLCGVAVRVGIVANRDNKHILIPGVAGLPPVMRPEKITVDFCENQKAKVSGRDWWVVVDFDHKSIVSSERVHVSGIAGGWENAQATWEGKDK